MKWISRGILAAFLAFWGSTAVHAEHVLYTAGTNSKVSPGVTVTADFGRQMDYPLSKSKLGVYNSGCVPLAHYDRDIGLFDEVKPHSLRIDLWWGGGVWSPQPVTGTPESIACHFDQMDHIAQLLNTHGIQPCWSYCYVPPPLQTPSGNWRRVAANAKLWGDILGTFAHHARAGGPLTKIAYHEIYNEPDNRDFFRGSREDYFALYREGSRAIRTADPDALIGGPALAFTPSWVAPFLAMVASEPLPLDFFSFHFYPGCWQTNTIKDVVRAMRRELARQPALATTEMHLNEFNSLPIDYPEGGRQDRYPLAAAMLQDYAWFLSQPDLSQVSWAQFQDTGGGNWSGMISIAGHRKAVFNAAVIYARMPGDRRRVLTKGGTVDGLASANERRASLVLWNQGGRDQDLKTCLRHVPFSRGTLRVFRIDAQHSSWGDNPASERLVPSETRADIATAALDWVGRLPKDGVIYFEVDSNEAQVESAPLPETRMVRVLHYYPDRNSRAYADFDAREWTARLGMATETKAHNQIGVVAEGLPRRLQVRVQTDGKLRKVDANSLLALRLDYQVGTNIDHSVLFHGPCAGRPDLYDSQRKAPMPWGTGRQAERVIAVPNLAQFDFSPADLAPEGWSGRVQITFLMQNTGRGTRSKFVLRSP